MSKLHLSAEKRGVSIRRLNIVMALVTLVISVLLLLATFNARNGYSQLKQNTSNYIDWQGDAYELQQASDYLTEQVRCFTQTGKREYLDNYFEEAEQTRRRDRALESIGSYMGDTPVYQALESAMHGSISLMDTEYYAMRLTVEAYGYDLEEYPEPVRQARLSPEDAALSAAEKEARARELVFDDAYHQQKLAISSDMQSCVRGLAEEIGGQQERIARDLDGTLSRQRLLIGGIIVTMVLVMLLTLLLVISPLLRAVMYIRADEPIPIRGSDEFRFLAKTYNLMYEANREQKEQLVYEATHDQLTGIYNRSGYDFFLKNTNWDDAALVLFDVDKFKQINDRFGHETGDKVLKSVGEVVQQSFRAQDHVCRIGGDEFAVVMVHISNASDDMIQEKIARINNSLGGGTADGLPPVHLSCGVAFGAAHSQDAEAIFRVADAALYRVKHAGGKGCEVCR